ncbi:Nucleolar GTP-binding protein [Theobroma cacao]|uniref:Nucleolar GTP-binding protein n=1 Tax=Theobroma cacao TaxID=3641 RepID=A0A061GU57_THECC|nr:Nucleolar GTP-binding protein [Theobroma cacao]
MGRISLISSCLGPNGKHQLLSTRDMPFPVSVAALGRMCTVIKRISPSLAYLEQIRQHMARLPSIDPNTQTILICGYPNVGKSSFMNKITRADVDVQPYAFTTKSLFVGHTDYKYLRYQVIDTPGILDRPFEDHNIIEMCSTSALAHLRAAVLFFLDISGSCGSSIAQQAALFHSIKLSGEDMKLVMEMKSEAVKTVMGQGGEPSNEEGVLWTMSTLTEDGVIAVKNAACERKRGHLAYLKPVLEAKAKQAVEKEKRKTEKDLEGENGGAGVYSANLRKNYILANDEWKEDILPEILDGHNVYDFIDPDILLRLEELEREEGLRQAEDEDAEFEMHESRPTVPRKFDKNREFTTERMGRQLLDMGLDPSLAINRARSRSRGIKRERSLDRGDNDSGKAMDIDVDRPYKMPRMRFRSLSMSRSTSQLRPPSEVVPGEGFKDSVQKVKAHKLAK